MKIEKNKIRKLMVEVLKEGMPSPGRGGLAGLFSDELTQKLMALRGDEEFDQTEEIIPFNDAPVDYDIDSQVMISPTSRIRNIPLDAENPYVPGETYADTTKRVEQTGLDLMQRSKADSEAAAEKRRQANKEFKQSYVGDGTGVLPWQEETDSVESDYDHDLEALINQIKNIEFTMDEPASGDTTKILNKKEIDPEPPRVQERLSHGALIRQKYYGRY